MRSDYDDVGFFDWIRAFTSYRRRVSYGCFVYGCLATTCHSSSPLLHSSLIVEIDHRCYLLYSLLVVQPLLLHRFSDFQQTTKNFVPHPPLVFTHTKSTYTTHTTTSNNVNFFIELTPQKHAATTTTTSKRSHFVSN